MYAYLYYAPILSSQKLSNEIYHKPVAIGYLIHFF